MSVPPDSSPSVYQMAFKNPFSFPDLRSKIRDDNKKRDSTSHPSIAFNQHWTSICYVPGSVLQLRLLLTKQMWPERDRVLGAEAPLHQGSDKHRIIKLEINGLSFWQHAKGCCDTRSSRLVDR